MSDEAFNAILNQCLEDALTKVYDGIEMLMPTAVQCGCGIRVTNVSTAAKLEFNVEIEAGVPLGEVDWVAY